ncbi:hypothetical protein DSO57_1007039 [Entomophthora muscae]|uniref:Uncharacterized protein n=1 Tax=Entomophthora muscae TaxID=34485 RepID=A0ACC2RM82_9FUNG|nr:hypothetical protein DSO57_1007039 [Entomophthora muscae]
MSRPAWVPTVEFKARLNLTWVILSTNPSEFSVLTISSYALLFVSLVKQDLDISETAEGLLVIQKANADSLTWTQAVNKVYTNLSLLQDPTLRFEKNPQETKEAFKTRCIKQQQKIYDFTKIALIVTCLVSAFGHETVFAL